MLLKEMTQLHAADLVLIFVRRCVFVFTYKISNIQIICQHFQVLHFAVLIDFWKTACNNSKID